MNEQLLQNIKETIRDLGATKYKKGEWNGYEVYEPVYRENIYIGLPLVVLVKDGKARVSTGEEALDYLAYTLRNEPDEE